MNSYSEDEVAQVFSAENPDWRFCCHTRKWWTAGADGWYPDDTLAIKNKIRRLCGFLAEQGLRDQTIDKRWYTRMCSRSFVNGVEWMLKSDPRHAVALMYPDRR